MLLIGSLAAALPCAARAEALDADACVELALRESPQIREAEAKVREWEARLREVESIFYPKLQGMAFVAPMFTVSGDASGYEKRYTALKDWGPYTSLEAFAGQPLFTFGRAAAGEDAARERALVEKARVRETELTVSLEVRKMYWLRAYALSMMPSLENAAKIVAEALEEGRELFDKGEGEVTQADLAKLEYAATEVEKFRIQAAQGAAVATSALKHTMGLPESYELELADQKLPGVGDDDPADVSALIAEAAVKRPEWAQLDHGKKAAAALEKAELLANAPIVGIAAQFRYAWTPSRDDTRNPYHFDPYNELFGGIAIGLMFDLDPALSIAKAEGARAVAAQVEALEAFAKTGIPLRVRKAYADLDSFRRLAELSKKGVKAARKWMMFSATAYGTGTGEAKDVLEGVVAYLQAKKGEYDSLHGYHLARAELEFAVGR